MSVGFGIFLSAVLLATVFLYGVTKDRWDWRKISVGGILCLICGAVIYAWTKQPASIPRQTEYGGLRLGAHSKEVIYAIGKPKFIFDTMLPFVEKPIAIPSDPGNALMDNVNGWYYESSNSATTIIFHHVNRTVEAIYCASKFDSLWGSCPAVLHIRDGMTESTMTERLGQPDRSQIKDNTKTVHYDRIGVFFLLTQQRINSLGIKR